MKRSGADLLAALACMVLTPVASRAQYPYSLLATFGFGAVPEEQRYGSYAGSMALFWRLSSWADLGVEGGYQHFGTHPQRDIIGLCPIPPVGPCEGRITAERTSRGHLWFVGPILRLRLAQNGTLRPLAVFGLARYASGEHTRVTYSDDRGETVSNPAPLVFDRPTFGGIGVNGGLGLQGPAFGQFQWAVLARAHGAIGGMGGEFASVSAYTVTAGLTFFFGSDRK
jgi:hypothetical protein